MLDAASEGAVAHPSDTRLPEADVGVTREAEERDIAVPHEPTSSVPWLRVIQRNAEQLLTVVEDIVELARLEAGRAELAPKRCFPTREMFELVDNWDPRPPEAVAGRHSPPGADPRADSDGSRQAPKGADELLGNAIKYTDRGKIVITISMASSRGTSRRD